MTPRERIEVLLSWYPEVLSGIRLAEPRACSGDGCRLAGRDRWLCQLHGCAEVSERPLALMCPAYNHSSYRELERLLGVMAEREPSLSAAIRQRFGHYYERRVAWCKRCGSHPAEHIGRVHSHPPGRSVRLVGRVVRVSQMSNGLPLSDALRWLEMSWPGVVELPPDISKLDAATRLREVA